MAEEQKEPQQVTTKEPQKVTQVMKEPQRVTTKNPKKVEAGKRLAVHNRRRREEQRKEQAKLEKTASGVNQYYGIGAVIALGVIEPRKESNLQTHNKIIQNHTLRCNHSPTSLRWIKSILYYKNGQEEYSK